MVKKFFFSSTINFSAIKGDLKIKTYHLEYTSYHAANVTQQQVKG